MSANDDRLSPWEERWLQASAELAPEKALARAAGNARFLVSVVLVVSTVLTAFGGLTVREASLSACMRTAIAIVLILVTASVCLALASLVLRTKRVAVGDLEDVREWFEKELQRMRVIALAGWFLVSAVAISGVTAVARLLT